jgi:hypothetical protein
MSGRTVADLVAVWECPMPECGALVRQREVNGDPPEVCPACSAVVPRAYWRLGEWIPAAETTPTGELGGDIAGPKDQPFARDTQLVDTRRAVLLGQTDVAMVKDSTGRDICTILLQGRVNRSQEHSKVLYLTGADGMAALVTELIGVATRMGGDFGADFVVAWEARKGEMPTKEGGT